MNLIPVERGELSVGKPLPWPVYDQNLAPMMQRGDVIHSEQQLEMLLARNPLHEIAFDTDSAILQPGIETRPANTPDSLQQAEGKSSLKFLDLNLKIGDRLQLEPPPQLRTGRCIVRLLGYLENISLLVTAPAENGVYLSLLEGEYVAIRGFSGRKAFGFTSSILRICKLPFNYLHLSFPGQIQGTVIRKSPRVKTRIITTITRPDTADAAAPLTGTIVNLSSTGAQVIAREPLEEIGKTLKLAFRINVHNMDAYLTVCGAICRIFCEETEQGAGAQISHGLEFCDLQPNDRMLLQSLIYQQMIECPQSLV